MDAALNTASASNAYVSQSTQGQHRRSQDRRYTSHARIDIDNGVIITSAITNEAVAELNVKRR